MSSTISIKALLDASDVGRGIKNIDQNLSGLNKSVQKQNKAFKGLALGAAGFVAGSGIVSFFGDVIKGAEEAKQANDKLSNVFTSMGDKSGKAFDAAKAGAVDLAKQIKVPDDEINKVQTKLATFGAVWKDPIRGAEQLNRATAAAFDLEAAGFGSAENNVVQVGKALENPIKGMTALAKSGVTFTDVQKEQIKNLQEQGKLGEAQEIVLSALETQVKGTAKSGVTASQKMAFAWEEFKGLLEEKLLPIYEKVSAFIVDTLIPKIEQLVGWLNRNQDVLKPIAVLVGVVIAAFVVWTAVMAAFNAVLAVNPMVLVIVGIVALVAALIVVYKRFEAFRKVVDTAWKVIKAAFVAAWPVIKAVFQGIIAAIKLWWTGIKTYFTFVINIYKTLWQAAKTMWEKVSTFFGNIVSGAKSLWTGITNWVGKAVAFVKGIPGKIVSAIGNLGSTLYDAGADLIRGLIDGAGSLLGKLASFFLDKVPGPLKGAFKKAFGINSPSKVFAGYGKNMMEGLAQGLEKTSAIAEKATVSVSKGISGAFEPELAMSLSGGGATAGGNVTYNITVSTLAGGPEVGRQVVSAIRDYERFGGKGWRQ